MNLVTNVEGNKETMLNVVKDKLNDLCQKRWVRTFVPALAGFTAYGGWGYFCNMMHGWKMGLQSGFVQGSFSFCVTLLFNGVMEWLYHRIENQLVTSLVSMTGLVSLSYSINWVVGTPEILPTIAPGALFGSFYVFNYVKLLSKQKKQAELS